MSQNVVQNQTIYSYLEYNQDSTLSSTISASLKQLFENQHLLILEENPHRTQSTCKSAISGSLSRKGCTPWLFLGVASWMRESKLAAGMARLVLNVLAGLVLVLNLLMVNVIVEAGTHLDEPWFRWREGVVPFYFQARLHVCYPSIEGRKDIQEINRVGIS